MHSHLTCAFVGERLSSYRFGFDEEHPDCLKLKFLIATQIYTLVDNGVTTFLTSMELGMDTWGAEMVLQLKKAIPIYVCLPYYPVKIRRTDGRCLNGKIISACWGTVIELFTASAVIIQKICGYVKNHL